MERMALKSRLKGDEERSVIKYITTDPMKRSWSEESTDWDFTVPRQKDRRHSKLLLVSRQKENEALVNATVCLEKIVSMGQPVSLPPIKMSNGSTGGLTQWVLSGDN